MTRIKKNIVRAGAGILGLIALISGGRAIIEGASGKLGETAALIGDPMLLAALDNDFRFFAGIWMIVGLGLLVGAVLIEKKPDLIQIGLEAVFVGGLARFYAFSEYGPLPQFYAPIVIELVLPVVLLILLKTSQRSSNTAEAVPSPS